MMGQRFDKDSEDTHRIWIFPFANLVLRYERMLSAKKLSKYRSGTAARSASVKHSRQLLAKASYFVNASPNYLFLVAAG
jgi:hypothetical protein